MTADRARSGPRCRAGLAEDNDIGSASAAEREVMAAGIGPLAQALTRILAQQARNRKRVLSLRRTARRAMGTGGVPFRLVTELATR